MFTIAAPQVTVLSAADESLSSMKNCIVTIPAL